MGLRVMQVSCHKLAYALPLLEVRQATSRVFVP